MGKVVDQERLRRAFSERLHEVVDRLAEVADLATIEKVLSMADPFSGMGVAMHQAATADAVILRDPLAAARLRGVEAREQLVDEAGGLLRLSQVADRLGVTPQAVTGRRLRETILAVPMPNGEWVYPACQFADVDLVSGMDAFVRAFADDVDPWTKLSVLIAPSRRFGGKSALELLSEGREEEATSIAGTYGVQG